MSAFDDLVLPLGATTPDQGVQQVGVGPRSSGGCFVGGPATIASAVLSLTTPSGLQVPKIESRAAVSSPDKVLIPAGRDIPEIGPGSGTCGTQGRQLNGTVLFAAVPATQCANDYDDYVVNSGLDAFIAMAAAPNIDLGWQQDHFPESTSPHPPLPHSSKTGTKWSPY